MNCDVLQKRLLLLTRPDRPTAELRAHLTRCPACRQYQQRLVRLERDVARLPVPASTAKVAFLDQLLADEPAAAAATPLPTPTPIRLHRPDDRRHRRDRGLRKLALATGLAAGLVLFALSWAVWKTSGVDTEREVARRFQPNKPAVTDPLLARLVERDVRLARVQTPRERLETLADVADDLHAEICAVARAANGKDLEAMTQLYVRVLREGILVHGERLAAADKAVLGQVAARLSEAASQAEQLVPAVAAESAAPLRHLTVAARDVSARLHAQVQKG